MQEMDWVTNHKREVEFSVKLYKKSTAAQGTILIVNLLGIAWNTYELINLGQGFSAFGLGAFVSNTLWSLGFFAMNYGELRDAKEQQKRFKEWEHKEGYKEAVQLHQYWKKKYEEACEVFKSEQAKS